MNLTARSKEQLNSHEFQKNSHPFLAPMVRISSPWTSASPGSKTYCSKSTTGQKQGRGPPPSTQFSIRKGYKCILKELSALNNSAIVYFGKCVHTHSHEHTEWLFTPLAVLITAEAHRVSFHSAAI